MKTHPNVLWIMSDQHNAACMGCADHPVVKTPNLDRIAARGVRFSQAFCSNPICSPSRISFMTGQYVHTHQMFGNTHDAWPEQNPDTLACLFRRQGYQTALIGKSHMTRRWDADGFEHLRYTDLCDADANDPRTTHYFDHLVELGLADWYEEGVAKSGQDGYFDGSRSAGLPYEHSIEHYTGEQTLSFLQERDASRPFFVKMSFQRPGKDAVFCEWDGGERGRTVAIRTPEARLVFYAGLAQRGEAVRGELYDRVRDPGELKNLWNSPVHAGQRRDLTERLFAFCLGYQAKSDARFDRTLAAQRRHSPTALLHKGGRYWSKLQRACTAPTHWPPARSSAP